MENDHQKRPAPPGSYHFVTETKPGQRSQIRHHVAKEWWRKRKAPGLARFQRTKPRSLVPASRSSQSEIKTEPTSSESNNSEETIIDLSQSLHVSPKERTITSIPSSSSQSPSPYQSLGYTELDPFNGTQLSREDQNLLHHWTNVYAFEAFGQPDDPTFFPLSNAYIPIDLSNPASTHATLAHSASHLAHISGKSSSIPALYHKTAAIKFINEALNAPEIAVSDGTLAAVLRVLTFESFWGSEDAMRLHQTGLSQLVKQRGGLDTLRGNWKLEMRILLAPLLSSRKLPSKPSKFINVFSELAIPGPEISILYPAIGRAMEYLNSLAENLPYAYPDPSSSPEEIERLMCIVYISYACTRSQHTRFNLAMLNKFLEMTEEVWSCSVSTLHSVLIQSVGKGNAGLRGAQRIWRLAEMSRLLTVPLDSSLKLRHLDLPVGVLRNEVEAPDD